MSNRLSTSVAALVAVFAATLIAAAPSLAGGWAAPATHPGNSGNTGNSNNSSNAGSNGKPGTTPTPGHGAPTSGSANGIAQSIGAASIVLTELDGSTVSIAVTRSTRVFVDGIHASLGEVKPGFVVSATWLAGKAKLIEAFNLASPGGVEVGVVASISTKAIVAKPNGGGSVTIRVGPHTRVLLDGDPATLGAVKAGDTVVYSPGRKGNAPATVLRFLRPG